MVLRITCWIIYMLIGSGEGCARSDVWECVLSIWIMFASS